MRINAYKLFECWTNVQVEHFLIVLYLFATELFELGERIEDLQGRQLSSGQFSALVGGIDRLHAPVQLRRQLVRRRHCLRFLECKQFRCSNY